jgi:hypothetical protein
VAIWPAPPTAPRAPRAAALEANPGSLRNPLYVYAHMQLQKLHRTVDCRLQTVDCRALLYGGVVPYATGEFPNTAFISLRSALQLRALLIQYRKSTQLLVRINTVLYSA